jgi:hypothetical protein
MEESLQLAASIWLLFYTATSQALIFSFSHFPLSFFLLAVSAFIDCLTVIVVFPSLFWTPRNTAPGFLW